MRPYAIVVAIVAVIAAIFVSRYHASGGRSEPVNPSGMAVTVARASQHCFADQTNLSGSLVPSEEALVRPDSEGFRFAEITVEDGQRVKRDQVLARLVRADDPRKGEKKVLSPAAGIVTVKTARIGVIATAKGEPLFRIIVDGKLDAEAEVPAAALQKISAGQDARVLVPGIGEVAGRVKSKSSWVEPTTQLGRVRVTLETKDGMRTGSFAKVRIIAGQSCGITVPLQAILYGPEGAYLQAVVDNKVETRRVKVGLQSGGKAEIRQGVKENDIVVARAGAFLRDGDIVRPIFAEGGTEDGAKGASQ